MEKHETWLKFNHMEGTIMEALDMLNELTKVILTWTCQTLCTPSKLRRGSEKSIPTRNGFNSSASFTILGRSWLFTESPSGRWWGTPSQLAANPSLQLCLERRVSKTTRIPRIPGTTASWASTK